LKEEEFMRVVSCRAVVTLLFVSLLSVGARAQGVAPGSFELSGNGGITNLSGVDNKKGHGSFGFAGAYNLTSHLAVVGEYNYLMLGSLSEVGEDETVTASENLQMYGAAVRFSLINTRFVVPYVLAGGGGNSIRAKVSAGSENATGSESGGYGAVGGGVSFYAGHGFGIRPEFRYERQQFPSTTVDGEAVTGGGQNDMRGTVALFYQFGGRGRR
jgi:hypothetical protein